LKSIHMKTMAKHLLTVSPGETLYRTGDSSIFILFQEDKPVRLACLNNLWKLEEMTFRDEAIQEDVLVEVVSITEELKFNLELYRFDDFASSDVTQATFNHLHSFAIEKRFWKIFECPEYLEVMQNPHLQFIASVSMGKGKASLLALVHPVLN